MRLVYLLLGLVVWLSTAAADSIATIQLRNRAAVEIIPVIKPMLGTGDAVSGQGFKIFLRASPQTLAQVEEMIAALDVAAQVLQISVFQGSTRGLRELGFDANIQIDSGDSSASIGSDDTRKSNAGGSITYSTSRGSAGVSGISTQKRLQDNPIHQLRVSEGREGYIETGRQIPVFSGGHWIVPGTTVGGIEYKDVISGFYVLPRIHGDEVTLQISPFKMSPSGGNIATQSASTAVTGPIGQWLLIGGVSEQLRRAQSGSGSRISTQSRGNESIWIRADPVQ